MVVLGFLLAGIAVWNFIVGVWVVGLICAIMAVWLFVEAYIDY